MSEWRYDVEAAPHDACILLRSSDWFSQGEYSGGLGVNDMVAIAIWDDEDGRWEMQNTPYCAVYSRKPTAWAELPA